MSKTPDATQPTAAAVIAQALNDCAGGDGDPEWYRDDAATVLNELSAAGFVVMRAADVRDE